MKRILIVCTGIIAVIVPLHLTAGEKKDTGDIPTVVRIKVGAGKLPRKRFGKTGVVIRSEKDLKKLKNEAVAAQIAKQVNFDKQYAVYFAWSGSGQDRLKAVVDNKKENLVRLVYKPGRTRDLRPHVYCFAIRAGVKHVIVRNKFGGIRPKKR